jgi:hypothetical protein
MRTNTNYIFRFFEESNSLLVGMFNSPKRNHLTFLNIFIACIPWTYCYVFCTTVLHCSFLLQLSPTGFIKQFCSSPPSFLHLYSFAHTTSTSTYGCSRFSQNVTKFVSKYTVLHPQSSLHCHCCQNVKPQVFFKVHHISLWKIIIPNTHTTRCTVNYIRVV